MAHQRALALWAVAACALFAHAAAECCDASDDYRSSPFCLIYGMLTDAERAAVRAELGDNCDSHRAKQEKARLSEEDALRIAEKRETDEDDPKFLRFGKDGSEPQFLRFGKRKPNFLRFGKRKPNFLRFGKRKPNFLRFGKRDHGADFDYDADEYHGFAREMRKPNFLRFGKRKPNFLRFGKRKPNFLRFGKRKPNFLRFGKKSDADAGDEAEKRKPNFLRFGKKSAPQ